LQVTDVLSALLGLTGSEGAVQGIAAGAEGFADVLQAALAGAGTGGAGEATEANAPSGNAREALAWLASALGLADTPAQEGQQSSPLEWAALPEALRQRLTQLDALAGMWLANLVAQAASAEDQAPAGTTAGTDLAALPKAVVKVLKQLELAGVVLPESLYALAGLAMGAEGSGVTVESSTAPTRAVEGGTPVRVAVEASDDALGAPVAAGVRPEAAVDPQAAAPGRGASPFARAHATRWLPNAEPERVPAVVSRSEPVAEAAAQVSDIAVDARGPAFVTAAPARETGESAEAMAGPASTLPGGARLPTLSSVDSAVQALLGALQRAVGASDGAGVPDGGSGAGVQAEAAPEQLRVARVVSGLVRQVGLMPAPTADASVSASRWLDSLRTQFLTGESPDGTAPQGRAAGLGVLEQAVPNDVPAVPAGVIRAVPAEAGAEAALAQANPPSAAVSGGSARVTPPVAAEPPAIEVVSATEAAPAPPREAAAAGTASQAVEAAVAVDEAAPVPVTVRVPSGTAVSGRVSWQPSSVTPTAAAQASDLPPVIRVGTAEFVTGAPAAAGPAPATVEDPSAVVARVVRAAASGRPQVRASGRLADATTGLRGVAHGTLASAAGDTVSGPQTGGAPPVQAAGALSLGTDVTAAARGSDADAAPDTSGAGVDRVELLQQIHDAVSRMRISRRGGEVSLRLKPEHLGDLRVAVSVADGVVRARIVTDSPAVRTALEADVAALRRSLSDSGLVVDSIQVSVGGDGASRFSPQKDRSFYSEVYRSFEPRAASALEAVAPAVGLLAVAGAAAGATSLSVLV